MPSARDLQATASADGKKIPLLEEAGGSVASLTTASRTASQNLSSDASASAGMMSDASPNASASMSVSSLKSQELDLELKEMNESGSVIRAKEQMEQGSTSPVPVSKMNVSAGAREVRVLSIPEAVVMAESPEKKTMSRIMTIDPTTLQMSESHIDGLPASSSTENVNNGNDKKESSGGKRGRFAVLPLAAGTMFGSYYFFDQCSASETAVIDRLGISETQFGLLQSVYSIPNVALPFFGGILIDKFAARNAVLLFMSFVFLGQFLFSWALFFESFPMALAARGKNYLTILTLFFKDFLRFFHGCLVDYTQPVNIAVIKLQRSLTPGIMDRPDLLNLFFQTVFRFLE